jgi:capsular polysaccharide biosynthesis protein
MEIVSIIRILRRHWLLVLPGVALAVLVALSVLYRVSLLPPGLAARDQSSGVATARVLLAANDQPAFDLDSRIASTVTDRASLVADLAATDAATAQAARRAGVDPAQLVILGPAAGAPAVPVPIAAEATSAAAGAGGAYRVNVSSQPTVPIIEIHASAPDAATAARLAVAVRTGLEEIVHQRTGPNPAVTMERLGPVVARDVVSSPKKAMAVIALTMVLVLWLVGLVVLVEVVRRLRAARAAGQLRRHPASA